MYLDMANGKANLRVVIIYDTMWKSTEQMTVPIMQGIKDEGVDVQVIKLRQPRSALQSKNSGRRVGVSSALRR